MPVRKIRWAVIMRETWQCSPSSVTPYGRLFEICESVKLKETRGTRFVPIRNDRRTCSVKFRSACININTHKYIYIFFHAYKERRKWLFIQKYPSIMVTLDTEQKSERQHCARRMCAICRRIKRDKGNVPFAILSFFFFFFLIKKLYFFISAIDKSWGPR